MYGLMHWYDELNDNYFPLGLNWWSFNSIFVDHAYTIIASWGLVYDGKSTYLPINQFLLRESFDQLKFVDEQMQKLSAEVDK